MAGTILVRQSALLQFNSLMYTAQFTQAEVHHLVWAMDMPSEINCLESHNKEDAIITLCKLLQCLAYPTCLFDKQMWIYWERSQYSGITHATTLLLLKICYNLIPYV